MKTVGKIKKTNHRRAYLEVNYKMVFLARFKKETK